MDGKTCNHIRHTTIVYEVVRKESNVLRKIEVMCTKFSFRRISLAVLVNAQSIISTQQLGDPPDLGHDYLCITIHLA